jgi:hypothetical protein
MASGAIASRPERAAMKSQFTPAEIGGLADLDLADADRGSGE